MKHKRHFIVSSVKSALRIGVCAVALGSSIPLWANILCVGLIIAEALGVVEEIVADVDDEEVFDFFGLEPQETEEE